MPANWTGNSGNKLDDCLMRNSYAVLLDTTPQNVSCNFLLLWKARVEPINEKVRVNESGHERKDLLWSSLDFYRAVLS